MARQQQTHWLRENAQERSPRRVLVVDTETRPASEDDPERQVLRLWCARLDRRRDVDPGKPRQERWQGYTAGELVDLVESLARSDHALWLFTHNLSFDLAVTELPVHLVERGWRITEAALTTDSPWCRLARKSRRLTVADTFSWLPTGVETLGELLRRRKVPLPEWDEPDAAWFRRCQVDVEITADAILSVMDWWDAGHLGNWSITGPATGWSSYRHRRPAPRVLVVPDPEARALEMRAVTGGRREVRRLGELPRGLYADLDLATAHLTAMAGMSLPSKRIGRFETLELDHRALESEILDVLAIAEVETESPRYPWDSGHGVFYPVGRFHSVLAGPELREARRRGELRSIGAGHLYMVTPHMTDWALWLASLLDQDNRDVPPAVRLLAKHWSRCVPGKWAGHTSDVVSREPDPRPGWSVERAMLMPSRRPADLLLVGGERWTIVRDEWADDAFPAILAFIQSGTRVAIGRLIDHLGAGLVSVNTDGALVDVQALLRESLPARSVANTRGAWQLQQVARWCVDWDAELAPFAVRVKGAAGQVHVISPQHVILDDERRLAGIPRKAVALAGGRYVFTAWPKLRVQLQRQERRGYSTHQQTVDLAHVPPTGWLYESGHVAPVVVWPDAAGVDRVTLWPSAPPTWGPLAPPERQHAILRQLMGATEAAA